MATTSVTESMSGTRCAFNVTSMLMVASDAQPLSPMNVILSFACVTAVLWMDASSDYIASRVRANSGLLTVVTVSTVCQPQP